MRTRLIATSLTMLAGCAATGRPTSDFTSATVDFGIVVSDLDRAAAFYVEGLGLTETPGFAVSAEMGGDSGLTDGKPFHVRVFKTSDASGATSVKLMEFPGATGAEPKNDFIHTTLGVSYLTLYVADIDAAVKRAREAGAPPLAKGPVPLPKELAEGIWLALVRDPDGNMIELIGPKAE